MLASDVARAGVAGRHYATISKHTVTESSDQVAHDTLPVPGEAPYLGDGEKQRLSDRSRILLLYQRIAKIDSLATGHSMGQGCRRRNSQVMRTV
jgi:hypothetical protein